MKLNQLKENNTMKPICFIGARGGSKGVPKKNIKKLNGKPLIAYSIESAISSKLFSHVIVSTDDKKIASVAREFGAEVPFLRPKRLATDSIGFDAVLLHGIKELFSLGAEVYDLVGDTNTAKEIEEWFDDVNPWDDEAEARTVGKITGAIAQIALPAGYGFKVGSSAAKAWQARTAQFCHRRR